MEGTRWRGMALVLVLTAAPVSRADDFGCKVLLCLANTAGNPVSAECAAILEELWQLLMKPWVAFPTCETVAAPSDSNSTALPQVRMVEVNDPFDPCPSGLRVQMGYVVRNGSEPLWSGDVESDRAVRGPRACVGREIGTAEYARGGKENREYLTVPVYDRIIWQQPSPYTKCTDVYVNGAFYQRVRHRG